MGLKVTIHLNILLEDIKFEQKKTHPINYAVSFSDEKDCLKY